MVECGFKIVSGGTDTHLMLVDLRPKKLTGKVAQLSLEEAGITCNKNGVPFDPEKPTITSGLRLGTPAATTRGFGTEEFRQVGLLINEVLDGLVANPDDNGAAEKAVRAKVEDLCSAVPHLRGILRRQREEAPQHAMPVLRPHGYPGEGFEADRG